MVTKYKRTRIAMGRVIWAAVLLLILLVGIFALGIVMGNNSNALMMEKNIAYPDFENQVREQLFATAEVDGNVIIAHYRETGEGYIVAVAPDIGRAVDLMLKKGVVVEALRPVPATGLSLPLLVAIIVPYILMAWFGIAVANAAAAAPVPQLGGKMQDGWESTVDPIERSINPDASLEHDSDDNDKPVSLAENE